MSWTKFRAQFSWKEATIQRVLEHRSSGIAIVEAVTRQLLAKILQAGNDLVWAVVICIA
jgi:hypothetical protein